MVENNSFQKVMETLTPKGYLLNLEEKLNNTLFKKKMAYIQNLYKQSNPWI